MIPTCLTASCSLRPPSFAHLLLPLEHPLPRSALWTLCSGTLRASPNEASCSLQMESCPLFPCLHLRALHGNVCSVACRSACVKDRGACPHHAVNMFSCLRLWTGAPWGPLRTYTERGWTSGWEAGEPGDRRQTSRGWDETSAADPTHLCRDTEDIGSLVRPQESLERGVCRGCPRACRSPRPGPQPAWRL